MKQSKLPIIVREYLNRDSSLLKIEFDQRFCEEGDLIASGYGKQLFHVDLVEDFITYLKPEFANDQNEFDKSVLLPGTEYKVFGTCVGEYDTVISSPISKTNKGKELKHLPTTPVVIEEKKGVKIILRIKK